MKSSMQLIEQICKMEPLEFAGLARLLGVQIVELNDESTDEKSKYKPRSFTDIISEVLDKYEKLNRVRKREILKLIKKSNSVRRSDINANNAADSE